ncbi:Hsp20/alpha crystallin family protein [bacterium]|nr:Hsp20/alpha crystallin family protein [bacterium]
MSIIRYNPINERGVLTDLFNVQKEMSKMFSNFFTDDNESFTGLQNWYPSADITEGKDKYTVHIELPGVTKDGVKITLQENVLTVQGEKKQEAETKDENFHRVERSYGSFSRSFRLPSLVKSDKIDANYKDGVLTIVLPKAEEAKAKQIDIKF